VHLIDYSPILYEKVHGEPTPPRRTGKFVVISVGEVDYLVLAPMELSAHHAHLVERFAVQHGLDGILNQRGDYFALTDAAGRVEGGGRFEIEEQRGVLRLWGRSEAYGPVPPAKLREINIQPWPEWLKQILSV